MLTARIDALPAGTQVLVKVGAVIGRVFAFRVLKDVYPMLESVGALRERLVTVERAQIAEQESPDPDPAWIFKHALIRDVAYGMLVFEQRRSLHRTVAEWYESRHEDERAAHIGVLAHHWEQAEEPARAIRYLDEAGSVALRSGAYHEAARQYSHALELSGDGQADLAERARRARWHQGVGTAMWELGDKRRSRAAHERAIGVAGIPISASGLGRMFHSLRIFVTTMLWLMSPSRTRAETEEEREIFQCAAVSATELAQACYFEEDTFGYIYYAFVGGLAATRTGRCGAQTDGMTFYGGVLVILRLRRLGERILALAREAAVSTESLPALHRHHQVKGTLYCGMGEDERVEAELEEAYDFLVRTGSHHQKEIVLAVHGLSQLHRGLLDEARAKFVELAASASARGARQHAVWGMYTPYFIDVLRGEDAGPEGLDAARSALKDHPDQQGLLSVLALGAVRELNRGDRDAAVEHAKEALAAMEGYTPSGMGLLHPYTHVAHVLLSAVEAGQTELLADAKRAVKELGTVAMLFQESAAAFPRMKGRLAAVQGKTRQAQRLYDKSIAKGTELDQPLEVARSQVFRGLLEPAGSPERARWHDPARRTLTELGARPWLERLG